MPKWKRGATEYAVSVNVCGSRGYQSAIPMPPIDMLGRPNRITFHVRGGEIDVAPGPEGGWFAPPRRGGRWQPGSQPLAADRLGYQPQIAHNPHR